MTVHDRLTTKDRSTLIICQASASIIAVIRREVADVSASAGCRGCIVEKASVDEVFIDMTSLLVWVLWRQGAGHYGSEGFHDVDCYAK